MEQLNVGDKVRVKKHGGLGWVHTNDETTYFSILLVYDAKHVEFAAECLESELYDYFHLSDLELIEAAVPAEEDSFVITMVTGEPELFDVPQEITDGLKDAPRSLGYRQSRLQSFSELVCDAVISKLSERRYFDDWWNFYLEEETAVGIRNELMTAIIDTIEGRKK